MLESGTNKSERAPIHLWIVGGLGLIWNAVGAFDYLMTQTRNESYMSQFSPEQLDFFYSFPAWVVGAWAIAVWGGLFGTLLLLLRKSLAVSIFLISVLAMISTTIHNYVFSNGMEISGDFLSLLFTAVIFLIALGLLFYSRAMKKRGVLG